MNTMKRFLVTCTILLATFAIAQAPDPLVSVSTMPKQVQAGSKLTFTVTLAFANGFHAYQNPSAAEYEIPVTVKVANKDFKVIKVAYPVGTDAAIGGSEKTTKAYEGTVKIPVTVQVPTKIGVKELKVAVGYQQCDETSCFPPGEIVKTVKVNVVKKAVKG